MRNPEWESTLLKKNGAQISTKLILSPPCQTGSKMGEGIQLCNDVKKQFKVMLVAEPCTGQEQQAFCPPPSSPWGLEFCLQKFPNLLQIIFPPPWIVPVRAPESSLVFLINFYWAHFHDQCRIISYNSAHGKKFKRRISFYYIVLLEYYMCTWKPLSFSTSRDFIGHPWLIMYHLYCICNK